MVILMLASFFATIPQPLEVYLREWVWWTLLNGFSVPLALPAVLAFLVLLLFFKFGIGLGLPRLFWQANPKPQFMVGIGIGAVLWQLFLAGYIFEEFATNFTIDRPPFCEIRQPYHLPDGLSGGEFPGRFRYEPASVLSIWRYAFVVVTAVTGVTLTVAVIVRLLQLLGRAIDALLFGWRPFKRKTHVPHVNYKIWLPLGAVVSWFLMSGVTAIFIAFPQEYSGDLVGRGLIELGGWGDAASRRARLDLHIHERKVADDPNGSRHILLETPGSSASP